MCNAKFQRTKLSSTSFISSKEVFAILSQGEGTPPHKLQLSNMKMAELLQIEFYMVSYRKVTFCERYAKSEDDCTMLIDVKGLY